MKQLFCMILIFTHVAHAQVVEPVTTTTEQQLEIITEKNENAETEDDAYLQQMHQFLKHPVNLNTANEEELKQLPVLTALQIQNLVLYRSLVGKLIDIHELQSVPGWHPELIRKIRPYLAVSSEISMPAAIKKRLRHGEHSLLLRGTQVLERSKGYLHDSSSTNFYPGSPQKILLRYKYVYRNLLQYGIVAEKDAGEQFFKGKQKQGFDFYSAHIFIKNVGIIHSLAIGDFTINLGQGLLQWQGLGFKKSAEAISIKREAAIIRPYNSAGEINFHRGAAITIGKNNWQLTTFVSFRKIDANLLRDSLQREADLVSSFQTSGYHRTKTETDDKGIQRQLAFGGNFSYRYKRLRVGINGIQHKFSLPVNRSAEPYNKYALSGNSFANYSIDYSYSFKNIHFFGEGAFTAKMAKAFTGGLMMSVSSGVDLALLYRNIQRSYQSLYANAFTESSQPTNERGIYAGITVRPGSAWRIDAYADLYKFPWLRYRVDGPSAGADYLVQATYKPGRQLEIYTRYHAESKAINVNPGLLSLSPVLQQPRKNWRTQVNYRVNQSLVLRNRVEMLWFDKKGAAPEEGILMFIDILFNPLLKPYSLGLRLQYFETGGYNSRLYAFENDVLYSYSVPVFYDKGYRYYLNLNYDITKKLSAWARWAQTIYKDKNLIGSGLDEISGNTKSELRIQAIYKF